MVQGMVLFTYQRQDGLIAFLEDVGLLDKSAQKKKANDMCVCVCLAHGACIFCGQDPSRNLLTQSTKPALQTSGQAMHYTAFYNRVERGVHSWRSRVRDVIHCTKCGRKPAKPSLEERARVHWAGVWHNFPLLRIVAECCEVPGKIA